MKTRDRILLTSLTLFNELGEANVTTVDIAIEMEISPGNLYYHFKGKEAIIEQLYTLMESELLAVLDAGLEDEIDVENAWFYLYVVFEQIYKYRYFYRNIADLLARYPALQKRFAKVLGKKRKTALATLQLLADAEVVEISSELQHQHLADNIVMLLTYWLNFSELEQRSQANPVLSIHRGVFQVMSLIAPYLRAEYAEFYRECEALFAGLSKELGG